MTMQSEVDVKTAEACCPLVLRIVPPLAASTPGARMSREIAYLPTTQHLLDFKQFSVWFAQSNQIPKVLEQIGRERERTSRDRGEGRGKARDLDEYDRTYHHLFVWDRENLTLVGSCRVGRADELIARYGAQGIYLARCFDFAIGFHRGDVPAIELGRPFVVPEHQQGYYGFYLLWQGIGHLLCRWPRYRRLYGSVSLSPRYGPPLLAMICDLLLDPNGEVGPRYPMRVDLEAEWAHDRTRAASDIRDLRTLCRLLDLEAKDLPLLMQQYVRVGARLLAVGVDPRHANTPRFLFEVDVPNVERSRLNGFMGPGVVDYLRLHRPVDHRLPTGEPS